jgi:hypothetical protein
MSIVLSFCPCGCGSLVRRTFHTGKITPWEYRSLGRCGFHAFSRTPDMLGEVL